MEKLLTEKDLAERWDITTRTLQKWRNKNIGVPFADVGPSPVLKTIRYRLSDVIAYEERHVRGGEVPEHCKKAMHRAAEALNAIAERNGTGESAKAVLVDIRDQLRRIIGEEA